MHKEPLINLAILLVLLVSALIAYFIDQGYYVNLISRILIFALAGVGLNLALGYGGMVSLGHAAFFGIGGYITGIAATHYRESSEFISGFGGSNEMLLIWLIVILITTVLALLIGLISLRTTGVYFIMITLAFAQMVFYFAISWPNYGGEDGLLMTSRNRFLSMNTDNELGFFSLCFVMLILSILFTSRIIRSRFGSALEVARMNDVRLATVGINPYPIKLTAFIFSAIITAIAGSLFAELNRFVSPGMLSWQMSGEIIIFVLLGGVGRLYGPVVGAALFVLLETFIGGFTEHWKLFLGLVLLIVVLYANGGLMKIVAGEKRHE